VSERAARLLPALVPEIARVRPKTLPRQQSEEYANETNGQKKARFRRRMGELGFPFASCNFSAFCKSARFNRNSLKCKLDDRDLTHRPSDKDFAQLERFGQKLALDAEFGRTG